MRLAAVAVALVAVVALAVLFVPRELVGPPSSASPEPTAVTTESPSPSASGEATSSQTPSETPEPTTTPVAGWTGLDWSDGVVPFAPNTSFLADIVAWHGSFVGVGGTMTAASQVGQGTTFISADGLNWTITQQVDLPEDWSFEHVLPVGDGLLAFSNVRGYSCPGDTSPCPPAEFSFSPRLWYSTDGSTWTEVDSPSWRAASQQSGIVALASGEAGLVALFHDGSVAHTSDAVTWQYVAGLPASQTAIVHDVAAYDGGFVIVGRDGVRDVLSEVSPQPAPGLGRPAAWISPDGVTWRQADVEGSQVQGGELREVAAGAGGLFATGIATSVEEQFHDPTHGWASADGATWGIVGQLGVDLPPVSVMSTSEVTGDEQRMLILGSETPGSSVMAVSVSTDGVTWSRLAFTGATATLPHIQLGADDLGMFARRAWLLPDGVLLLGTGLDSPQEFWRAVAP